MASDKNTMPKGTTHICMNITHAFHAKRVHNGWCLQDGEGGWVFCGEEVEGYKVDIRTGIVWQKSDKEDRTRVLASVIRLKGERAIGVEGLRIPSGFSDVDHLITQRFVDGWEPAATPVDGPVNPVQLGRRIPVKFSCAVAQYAYDNGHPVDAFPRPGFYGRMAARMAIDLRELKAELAARDAIASSVPAMDVLEERKRQVAVEHRLASDDDDYTLGQLAFAAAAYAQGSTPAAQAHNHHASYWPWAQHWWKPGCPRRMLVKAGALILAEIERLDRIK